MCRSIKPLFNFTPPATDEDIRAAARQFVRKLSGFTKPSAANEDSFEQAIDEIFHASKAMLASLVARSAPKDRAEWEAKRRERFAARP